MANKEREKSNCSIYCEIVKTQFLGKLDKKEVFTTKKIDPSLRTSALTLSQMDDNTKVKIMDTLEEASELNKDFCNLKSKFVSSLNLQINLESFQRVIKEEKSGFYYKKAIFLVAISSLLLIIQNYMELFVMYPKVYCIDERIDLRNKLNVTNVINNEEFWIFDNTKYKVKRVKEDRQKNLRIISAICDAISIFCEFFALYRLERIYFDKCYIVSFHLIKYAVNFIIFFLDFFEEDYCYLSKSYKNNLEYKKNKVLEQFNQIFDFIKFLII